MNQEKLNQEPDEEVNQEVLSENFLACCTVQPSSVTSLSSSSKQAQRTSVRYVAESDHNWQARCKTLRERNAVMFNNELMADIHFLVGISNNVVRIPAHKYVLATASSVFYAMFFGGLADTNEDIKIPDVEPGAFLNLLRLVLYLPGTGPLGQQKICVFPITWA